jgi:hypothetical protein
LKLRSRCRGWDWKDLLEWNPGCAHNIPRKGNMSIWEAEVVKGRQLERQSCSKLISTAMSLTAQNCSARHQFIIKNRSASALQWYVQDASSHFQSHDYLYTRAVCHLSSASYHPRRVPFRFDPLAPRHNNFTRAKPWRHVTSISLPGPTSLQVISGTKETQPGNPSKDQDVHDQLLVPLC